MKTLKSYFWEILIIAITVALILVAFKVFSQVFVKKPQLVIIYFSSECYDVNYYDLKKWCKNNQIEEVPIYYVPKPEPQK